MSNSIFLVCGSHHEVPGVKLKAFATSALADAAAAEMVNILLRDNEMPDDATAGNWQEKFQAYKRAIADDLETDVDILTDEDCGDVSIEMVDLAGLTNHPQLISDLWGKIEDDGGDFFSLRERVRGALWHGESEASIVAGVKPLVFENAKLVSGVECLAAEAANGSYVIVSPPGGFELRLNGIPFPESMQFCSVQDAIKFAGQHYRAHMAKFTTVINARTMPMGLSDGTKDYFVEVSCDGRSLTPHKFKIEGRADYEVAMWDWLFQGGPKPDFAAFDIDGDIGDGIAAAFAADVSTLELMRPDDPELIEQGDFTNYRVVIVSTTSYIVDVAAESKEEARENALEVFNQSESPDEHFGILDADNRVESVETI